MGEGRRSEVVAVALLSSRLTQDVIFEQFPTKEFSKIKILDFPQSGLKIVDLSPVDVFDNLVRCVSVSLFV